MQFIATGVSMLPTYKAGDVLKVNILNRNISVGDIVVFKANNDNLIAHRVIF
ncbi:S24/S26 family peptidase [Virgibacillus pantothenticus]|uniref:S24/S26 family peptidase n=1 Tax=Virgibacillus pantothenticus TaxID=1473 RepID=UPI0009871CB0|nr:S24/S26 family peptidase [Virgibacillus pantothenticus]